MKKKENEKGSPRPTETNRFKRKIAVVSTYILILIGSICIGYETAPEETRLPVLLADGEVILQPCYVAVEGECIALVEDEAEAEEVVDRVKDEYKSDSTVKVEIEEDTSIENLDLANGSEKPEILTAQQATEQIVSQQSLTVKTTEVVETAETVEYKTIEKASDQMQLGELHIEQEGRPGVTHITKKVIKENGVVVSEEILEEEVVQASIPEIKVCGIRGLAAPLDELRLTSGFGPRWGRQHEGLDFGMAEGSPVYAAKDGVVTCASYSGSYGNLVKLDHGDGMETYYAHCSRIDVVVGQQVGTGQQIAAVGSTGNSTGPHLHFEVRISGEAQDPSVWLGMNQ